MLTRRWPSPVEDQISRRYTVLLNPADVPFDAPAMQRALASHEIVCPTVSDRIGPAQLPPVAKTLLLANYGAGVDHIDLEACRRAGIVVTNTPGVLTEATAELALTLILMAARRVREGQHEIDSGTWTGWRPTHLVGTSLAGKVLGLVGYGQIARALARKASSALGMRIAYHARRPAPTAPGDPPPEWCDALDGLLAQADVVSLHVPGGERTRSMIDAAALAAMKPGAILINTARGSVVDHAALVAALRSGHLAGAGLDVYPEEPRLPEGLHACRNAVLLPHLGSATDEARIAMGLRALANIDAFVMGNDPPDRVA